MIASQNDVVSAVELHKTSVVLNERSSLQSPQHRSCTTQLHQKKVVVALIAVATERARSVTSHNDVVGAVELHRTRVVRIVRSILESPQLRSCTVELHDKNVAISPIAVATERAPSVASHNDVVGAVELHRACVVQIVRSTLILH